MLTSAQLQSILPALGDAKRALYLPHLNAAMTVYGVDSPMRTAAFVAQLAHESAEFRFMEEIWGPTSAQCRYEPVCDLAKRLGNTEVGDGKRFKGRGPIQITGRSNYQRYGRLLGLDLIAAPERAATPEVGFATAGLYWKSNGLNELADAGEFIAITKRINGGTNGLAERERYFQRAKAVLANGFVAAPATRSRGAARATVYAPYDGEPLTRGREEIEAV